MIHLMTQITVWFSLKDWDVGARVSAPRPNPKATIHALCKIN